MIKINSKLMITINYCFEFKIHSHAKKQKRKIGNNKKTNQMIMPCLHD